jgi:hypothetical protein
MTQHDNDTTALAPNPERIWLEPRCNVDERSWCIEPHPCPDECGEQPVEYIRADLVHDGSNHPDVVIELRMEIGRLRAEIERLRTNRASSTPNEDQIRRAICCPHGCVRKEDCQSRKSRYVNGLVVEAILALYTVNPPAEVPRRR